MLKNYLFSPLCSAPLLYSSPLSLSIPVLLSSFSNASFFNFSFSAKPPFFLLWFSVPFFFFLSFVLPFLFNLLFFSPKPCWAQSPKRFASIKSAPLFSFSACLFVQLAPLFQPLFVLFQPLFFLFHVLPSKSPQTCSALFMRASFSVSCQLLRP